MKRRILIALVLLSVAAVVIICSRSASAGSSEGEPQFQRTQGVVFGTTYHISYSNPANEPLNDHIRRAMDAVNNSLSMFNPESTISRINHNQSSATDPLFRAVFRKGCQVSAATSGAFDMTVAPLVDLWGFGLKNRSSVSSLSVDSARRYVSWEFVVLEGDNIHKAYPEMRLDAGAIAKGYGCDVVADTLLAHGCTDFCVEIGGEVVVRGLNPKRADWKVGINKPVEDSLCINNDIQEIVSLSDCGMATSGNYRNYYELDGRKYSHTIDPRTGYPVQHNLLSATVIAPDCATADAWATACMVAGLDSAVTWISRNPDLRGYLIYEQDGQLLHWSSPDL